MADERDDPPAPPPKPPRKRRRPVPTIDLKATEVGIEPKAENAAQSTKSSATAADPPRRQDAASSPESPSKEPPFRSSDRKGPGRQIQWPLIRAVVAGVLAALLMLVGFWLAEVFSRDNKSVALSERLTLAETRLREISTRAAPAGPDARTTDELAARLGKLEAALAAPRPVQAGDPATAGRLAAVEEAIKSLQGAIAELARRADDNAAATREARGRADASLLAADAARSAVERSNLEALINRIAALERAMNAIRDEVAKSIAAVGDRPLRLAVSAQALRDAVESGNPFTAELAAVKPHAPDPRTLAPLEAFAASGVPTQTTLARELSEIAPAMRRLVDAPAASGGFLDRLQANAERLVRIRPIDEAPGDDPIAIIGRAEIKAVRSDIAGAAAELAKLPAPVRAPAEEWIKRAEARHAAMAASRRIASDALVALGRSP